MNTRGTLAVSLVVCLFPASSMAAPTAVEFQGVTIGSKLRTTPVDFRTKVGLVGGGSLAPGTYDVELASMGDRSRVMLLFFQKGRKMGETPGVLKLGTAPGGGVNPCARPGEAVNPCGRTAVSLCTNERGSRGAPPSSHYFSFEQLGFTGGVKPSLRAGADGGTLLTIPGAGGASVEAQLPAAH